MGQESRRVVGANSQLQESPPDEANASPEIVLPATFFETWQSDATDTQAQPDSSPSLAEVNHQAWGDCCTAGWAGRVWRVFDSKAVEQSYALKSESLGYTDRSRVNALMKTLRSRGECRKLACIPDDWRGQLSALTQQFPNFGRVVDYMRAAYALAEREDRVPRLSPMLLNGPPGVGKTLFASTVANLLGSGFVTVRMEAAQTASALTGSEEHWSNSKPGRVFSTLVERDFANPMVFVDEIDKAAGGEHDPLAGLFSLLEPGTAVAFADLSYPWVSLDASRVLWVCTSNDADVLPAPILDRLRRFDIEPPTPKQARMIVMRIFDEIASEMPSTRALKLSPKAIDALLTLSPRRIRQVMLEAVGRALYEGRSRILERDVPTKEAKDCAPSPMRIGFLP